MSFENVDLDVIGSARRVITNKDETTIIEGGGSVSEVDARVKQINTQADKATSEYDKENLEKRRAALSGKVAVIKVGGATETEIEEKKFRVDDAVHAVKAALDEGIVAGGGVTLINLTTAITTDDSDDSSFTAGKQLLVKALEQPFRILMTNSGVNPDEWLPQVKSGKAGFGVDVNSPNKLVDMKARGVIDPARVTKEAIQNGVSIAGTSMTMGALVVDVPNDDKSSGSGDMSGGMGGMM
jgi:chaperonin GroEL